MSNPALDKLRGLASRLPEAGASVPSEMLEEVRRIVSVMEEAWDHKELESRQFQHQLARAARLAELGIMAAAIFHEMNQPLLGIKGFAELILDALDRGDTQKLEEWVKEIRAQAVRMHQMQRNIASFLRRDEQAREPISIQEALEPSLRLFEHKMRRQNIRLGIALPDDLPMVDIASQHLHQILVNLVGNALDAMKDHGKGTLRIVGLVDDANRAVRLLVADTGHGLSVESRELLFEPFFTTKREKGTGLGLYISRTLAEANRGALRLLDPASLKWKDTPATVFELKLPIAELPATGSAASAVARKESLLAPPDESSTTPQSPESIEDLNRRIEMHAQQIHVTRRVLIVDDEPVILRVISEYLAGQNILADSATTAEEGLEKLAQKDYAVLVTDKNLPGMDGIEMLKEAKQRWTELEVIVITGFASVESALDAIGEGAFDYIPKPFPSLTYVGEKVRGALARHDFEVRIRALVDYLSQAVKDLLEGLSDSQKSGWVQRLRDALDAYNLPPPKALVAVVNSASLSNTVNKLGHLSTPVSSLDEARSLVQEQPVQVVVFVEEEGGMLGADAVRDLHAANPDVGVFIIAREGNLKQIVNAIGVGAGDYLIRPLEGREMFGPRVARLIHRQQRITRYRRLLDSLKRLNIDLITARSG